jgi:hypothetical protein
MELGPREGAPWELLPLMSPSFLYSHVVATKHLNSFSRPSHVAAGHGDFFIAGASTCEINQNR